MLRHSPRARARRSSATRRSARLAHPALPAGSVPRPVPAVRCHRRWPRRGGFERFGRTPLPRLSAWRARAESTSTWRMARAAAPKKCARHSKPASAPISLIRASLTRAVGCSVLAPEPSRADAMPRSSRYTRANSRSPAARSPACQAASQPVRSTCSCMRPRPCRPSHSARRDARAKAGEKDPARRRMCGQGHRGRP